MSSPFLAEAQAKMKKAVDHTLHEFSSIHTGKATPAMVETVLVEAYGSRTPFKFSRGTPHSSKTSSRASKRPTSVSTRSPTAKSSAFRCPT